jgi:anti-sigma B factor antagonist
VSQFVPVPPSLPPLWAARGPMVSHPAPTGRSNSGGGQRPGDRQLWDDRVAVLARPDISCLQVSSLTAAGASTVTVSGEIDCLTAPGLHEVLLDVLDRPHIPGGVVLDLRRVTFLDAAGLTVLAAAHHLAANTGGVLRICCGTARAVIRPLQLTGLWEALHIVERERADDGC